MMLDEVRRKYLDFFAKKGHVIIPSASLVPENDPTTLFTGSGMQPLLPYLLGQKHPAGTRLVNSQKCFRAEDMDEVGDNRHTTFFEMLGNWSLGDYFKTEQLPWLFEFLTDEIKLDPNKIYVTVFAGEFKYDIPKDVESAEIWKKLFAEKGITAKDVEIGSIERGGEAGMRGGRIFYYDARKNWWSRAGTPEKMPVGEPGGPDSEVFYEFTDIPHDKKFGDECHPNCDCGRFMEIGNSVFMEYRKTDSGFEKLAQKNVDFGGGLERITSASNDNADIFKIDIFDSIVKELERLSGKSYSDKNFQKSFRVVADHARAAIFLMSDGVNPSNTDKGYFVRRLIRRAVRFGNQIGLAEESYERIIEIVSKHYAETYSLIRTNKRIVLDEFIEEVKKFSQTLDRGLKEFERIVKIGKGISGHDGFLLFSSYGFPIELTKELAQEKNIALHLEDFETEMEKHREISKVGAEKKFKGGLADTGEVSVKYHTATHLLHQALRDVLGNHVGQKGSNITPERLRFDFTHSAKMTPEEIKKVEDIVNEKIKAGLPVQKMVLPFAEAEKTGALHFFGEKYGDQVNVYFIGNSLETAFSKEFCGGPHVANTSELGNFKISKEEAVSAGVRRIKAVLG